MSTRRDFIKTTGQLAAASALAGVALPHVHAAGDSTLSVALVGCGGRGSGAVVDARQQVMMEVQHGRHLTRPWLTPARTHPRSARCRPRPDSCPTALQSFPGPACRGCAGGALHQWECRWIDFLLNNTLYHPQ